MRSEDITGVGAGGAGPDPLTVLLCPSQCWECGPCPLLQTSVIAKQQLPSSRGCDIPHPRLHPVADLNPCLTDTGAQNSFPVVPVSLRDPPTQGQSLPSSFLCRPRSLQPPSPERAPSINEVPKNPQFRVCSRGLTCHPPPGPPVPRFGDCIPSASHHAHPSPSFKWKSPSRPGLKIPVPTFFRAESSFSLPPGTPLPSATHPAHVFSTICTTRSIFIVLSPNLPEQQFVLST